MTGARRPGILLPGSALGECAEIEYGEDRFRSAAIVPPLREWPVQGNGNKIGFELCASRANINDYGLF